MSDSIRGRMARGALWMVSFKFIDRGIGFLSTLILARMLTPDQFGLVAMAMSFVAMLELIGAFGLDVALIQRSDAGPEHYNTAWTLNVLCGCTIALLMWVFADQVAAFYQQPELAWVICVLALNPLFRGLTNIGVVAFRKELEFSKEFRFLVTKRLITFPITITLAVVLGNYWALVIGVISGGAAEMIISYWVHAYRPWFSFKAVRELIKFSKWMLLLNVLGFLKERSHEFIIGRLAGARSLGLFNLTYELANLPGTELVAPINRAVLPAYAKLANDVAALRREYLSVMGMICLIAIPPVAGMAATAKWVVPVLFGPHWIDAVPILQLLAFYGITQVIQSNAFSLCVAVGRANVYSTIQVVHVVSLIGSLIVLTRGRGVDGAALAYLATASVLLPVTIIVMLRFLSIPLSHFLANLWRPLLAATLMFMAVTVFGADVPSTAPLTTLLPFLLAAVALGVVVYVVVILAAWQLSGRPVGAESVVLAKTAALLTTWSARRKRSTND